MREIVFDTETSGFGKEDRVVEIGAVELVDLLPTGNTYHAYINPQMKVMPAGALKVHGLTIEFLKKKPTMQRVMPGFLKFIGDSPLVAHNAKFDFRMINQELERLGMPPLANPMVDTQELAKAHRRGGRQTLDALMKRFKVDTERKLHGALLDSEILAKIYLELRGGRQFGMELIVDNKGAEEAARKDYGPRPFISRITPEEMIDHAVFISTLGPNSIWAQYINPQPTEQEEAA